MSTTNRTARTILITGATSGIGRHAALYLARKGYHVIATGRRQELLDELVRETGDQTLHAIRLDVNDAASIAAAQLAADDLTDGHGVDVLINNAGFGIAAPLSEMTDDDVRRQFETNVFGLLAVTRAFIPQMRERGFGKIINVSSVGGRMTMPFFGAYNASKYAVESLSDALRFELHPMGIDVVIIEPGVINTNFADRSLSRVSAYNDASSPYASVLAQVEDMQRQAESMGVSPDCIARAMHRAIKARRPRARYIAPFRTVLMLGLYKATPTRISDAAMRRVFRLTRKNLSLTTAPSPQLPAPRS